MKILLLGGTGAMGRPLAKILSEKGNDVYITSRQINKNDGQIAYLQGDAHNFDFLSKLLANRWDAIIDFMNYGTFEFECRYKLLLDNADHYLFLSSARVYADSKAPITEKSPRLLDISNDHAFLSTDEYALHKAREEDFLIKSGCNNYTIIRPYITYSDIRLQLGVLEKEQWLYRLLQNRTILFSNDISRHYTTMTYANDVAYCISMLINNQNAYGETYNIVTEQSAKWQDILSIYCNAYKEYFNKEAKVMMINNSLKLNDKAGQYQVIYDRYYDRQFDNSKIKKIVGDYKFTDIEHGLSSCFKDFVENPHFRNISFNDEKIRNKITKEELNLSEIHGRKEKLKHILRLMIK